MLNSEVIKGLFASLFAKKSKMLEQKSSSTWSLFAGQKCIEKDQNESNFSSIRRTSSLTNVHDFISGSTGSDGLKIKWSSRESLGRKFLKNTIVHQFGIKWREKTRKTSLRRLILVKLIRQKFPSFV